MIEAASGVWAADGVIDECTRLQIAGCRRRRILDGRQNRGPDRVIVEPERPQRDTIELMRPGEVHSHSNPVTVDVVHLAPLDARRRAVVDFEVVREHPFTGFDHRYRRRSAQDDEVIDRASGDTRAALDSGCRARARRARRPVAAIRRKPKDQLVRITGRFDRTQNRPFDERKRSTVL